MGTLINWKDDDDCSDDYVQPVYTSLVAKWNAENDTGYSCGTCPTCGSKIYQCTYADFCSCGEQFQSY